MPSFDVVSEVDKVELRNAVEQANKEIVGRFDFKGSDARIDQADYVLTLFADDEFKLDQVFDVLVGRFAKRSIDMRCVERADVEKVSGNKVKQSVTIKTGLDAELAKRVTKLIKDSKLKVTAATQGNAVRVSGTKRDTLQEAIALLRKQVTDFPLQYENFRD